MKVIYSPRKLVFMVFLHCYSPPPKKIEPSNFKHCLLAHRVQSKPVTFFENSIECNFHWYSDNGRMINIYYYPIYQLPVGPRMKVNCRFVYSRLRIVCRGIIWCKYKYISYISSVERRITFVSHKFCWHYICVNNML